MLLTATTSPGQTGATEMGFTPPNSRPIICSSFCFETNIALPCLNCSKGKKSLLEITTEMNDRKFGWLPNQIKDGEVFSGLLSMPCLCRFSSQRTAKCRPKNIIDRVRVVNESAHVKILFDCFV